MTHENDTGSLEWQMLATETAFSTPIFSILKDRTKCMRTGAEADFYRFEIPDWVNVIAVTPDDEVILIKQFRHGTQSIKLEVPGGVIDPEDEGPIEAGVRELLEETGYQGTRASLIGQVQPNPAIQPNCCYTVLVENAVKISEPRMEDLEDIHTLLYSRDDINQMICSGKIDHGLVLNALYFYDLYIRGNCK